MLGSLAITLALALILANGLLVAAEFAFVRVRPVALETRARAGGRWAKLGLELLRNIDSTLATTQIGITLANLGIGWLGEPAVARLLEPMMTELGLGSYTQAVSFGVAFGAITFLTVVVGELVPRAIGIRLAEPIVLALSPVIRILRAVLYPFVALTNRSASLILRLLGVPPLKLGETAHTVEELRTLLALSHDRGHLPRTAREILDRALGFSRLTARQIMIPRPDVAWLSTLSTPAETLESAKGAGYTRFPVCEGDLDRVLGVVHIKDLLGSQGEVDLISVMRPPLVVPETATADALLRLFQRRPLHLAIVVDEYGGTAGIVTLEDVLEEIVGELRDEFDVEPSLISTTGEGRFELAGSARLADVAKALGADETGRTSGADTVAGYVLEKLGRMAREGDGVPLGEYQLRVALVRGNRVLRIEASRRESADAASRPPAGGVTSAS
jgi:CBS domain containing-hemolysin-like protein